MTSLLKARTLTVSIACPPATVYDFVSDPRNLPRWSFFGAVTASGDQWITETPDGPVRLRFAPRNDFGVLDHRVTLPAGDQIDVPMRVIANGEGSEVLFTLFQQPGMPDEELERDAGQVQVDLNTLKALMEDAQNEIIRR